MPAGSADPGFAVTDGTSEAVGAPSDPSPAADAAPAARHASANDLATDNRLWGALARHPQASALLGAFSIAFSGILVREAAVSPTTAATFRAGYAVPFLAIVA